jgi:hypothetical protein
LKPVRGVEGILPQAQFSNTVVTLNQGDILTLFTDGVTEQENEAGDEFSIKRLEEVVRTFAMRCEQGINAQSIPTGFSNRQKSPERDRMILHDTFRNNRST